jgi:hypothetical protein
MFMTEKKKQVEQGISVTCDNQTLPDSTCPYDTLCSKAHWQTSQTQIGWDVDPLMAGQVAVDLQTPPHSESSHSRSQHILTISSILIHEMCNI